MRQQEVPKEVPRGLLALWRPDRVRGRDGEERVRSFAAVPKPHKPFPMFFFVGCRAKGGPKDSLVRSLRGKREEVGSRGKKEGIPRCERVCGKR